MANLYHYVEQTANTDSSRLKFFGYAKLIDQVYVTYSDFITQVTDVVLKSLFLLRDVRVWKVANLKIHKQYACISSDCLIA